MTKESDPLHVMHQSPVQAMFVAKLLPLERNQENVKETDSVLVPLPLIIFMVRKDALKLFTK